MGSSSTKKQDEEDSKPLLQNDAFISESSTYIDTSTSLNQNYDSANLVKANRLKYYNTLASKGHLKFELPENYLPPALFVRGGHVVTEEIETPDGRIVNKPKKQSSVTTVFSIANTMLGSSLLALPWGFTQSGFVAGMGVILVIGLICFYTAALIVKDCKGMDDFSDICKVCFGKPGQYVTVMTSVLVLIGAAIAYDIIMSSSLFDLVNGIISLSGGDSTRMVKHYWNHLTAPIVIVVLLFPLINLKDFSILVKLNTVGVLAIFYLLFYIPFVSLSTYPHVVFPTSEVIDNKFFYLAGILTLAFFIHNCALSILKNNEHPENNVRDLGLAYLLVAGCYAVVGGVAYLCYYPNQKNIMQDFLTMQPEASPLAMIGRGFVVLQLASVFPLLLFIIRIQFFGLFWGSSYPGMIHVLILNTAIVICTTLFAMYFPNIGTVLRYTGAFCGFVYVFALPIIVHWMLQKQKGELTVTSIIFNGFILLVGVACMASQLF